MSSCRGADHLVQAMVAAGVTRIFTLSGNQIMPVFDACFDAGIELLHVRHEAAAVHMADAWGRLTGTAGVAMVTGGPGHANAVSALYTAKMSESPMILLSGHAPQSQLGQGAFQEMAQARIAKPVSKAAWTVQRAADMGPDFLAALATATQGRPGPVHLSLPFDLLNEDLGVLPDLEPNLVSPDVVDADGAGRLAETAERIRAAIDAAKRPMVVAGSQLLRTFGDDGVAALANVLGAPVVASDSPRGLADPALGAFAQVLPMADLVVALGRSVDFTLRMGRAPFVDAAARFILLDPDAESLATTHRAIADDSRVLMTEQLDCLPLARLLASGAERPVSEWTRSVRDAVAYRPAEWETLRAGSADGLHALEVSRALRAVYADFGDTVLIMDGGEFGQWSQATLRSPRQTTNGPGGSIGSAIPMAIAARVACPDASVLAVLGDGTFGFHMAEFDTAVRYGLDFVAVVGNDACWNAEYQIQMRDYGPDRLIGCELQPTRYDRVVEAMGGHGEYVTRSEDLQPAIERARASGLPACVNVALERNAAPLVRRKAPPAAAQG